MTNERRLFASLSAIDDEVNRRLHRRLVDAANAAVFSTSRTAPSTLR